jgi:hypothetical protein
VVGNEAAEHIGSVADGGNDGGSGQAHTRTL